MKDLYVSWDEYNRLIEDLAVQIHDSGWSFDAIVCLARGGLRVGDVLSRLFERPLGVMFASSYREAEGMRQGGLYVSECLSSARPLPPGRWLMADDLADSGTTLLELPPVIRARFPQVSELRTAVIWCKGVSAAMPDYCVQTLPDSPWIHQPFEEYDHLRPADLKARRG